MPVGIYIHKKGWHHTEEAKQRMRENHKGTSGKECSEETKRKISEAQRGNKNHNFGKHFSDEVKRKMSERRKGISPWNKGKKLSEEHRRKLSEALRGEKCHLWKGGITLEDYKIRTGIEMRLWRESVFARDSWTCQKCGDNKGRNLNAHHIHNFSTYVESRTSIGNGITFCDKCHKEFHKIYDIKNNTKEQLKEFLEKPF